MTLCHYVNTIKCKIEMERFLLSFAICGKKNMRIKFSTEMREEKKLKEIKDVISIQCHCAHKK